MAKTLEYDYAVRDRTGSMVKGRLKADSPAMVATKLKSMGYAPVSIKQAMFDWLGPVIHEIYAASEGPGTWIGPDEWLAHRGSVGRRFVDLGDDPIGLPTRDLPDDDAAVLGAAPGAGIDPRSTPEGEDQVVNRFYICIGVEVDVIDIVIVGDGI